MSTFFRNAVLLPASALLAFGTAYGAEAYPTSAASTVARTAAYNNLRFPGSSHITASPIPLTSSYEIAPSDLTAELKRMPEAGWLMLMGTGLLGMAMLCAYGAAQKSEKVEQREHQRESLRSIGAVEER